MPTRPDFFLSYSAKDAELAKGLRRELEERNVTCFMADRDIKPGSEWEHELREKLKTSPSILFLSTPSAANSFWINAESAAGWALGKELIPVLVDGTTEDSLNELLKKKQGITVKRNDLARGAEEIAALKRYADFWKVFFEGRGVEDYTYVVLSAKGYGREHERGKATRKPGDTIKVSYNELDAVLALQNDLEALKDRLRIVHAGYEHPDTGELNKPDYPEDGHLIVLGSIHGNKTCMDIMNQLQDVPFGFEPSKQGRGTKNDKYVAIYDPGSRGVVARFPVKRTPSFDPSTGRHEDYGIILRTKNPKGKSKILILGGNHGFGTESAVKFVANRNLVRPLHGLVEERDFALLFRAAGDRKHELTLEPLRLEVLEGGGVWQQRSVDRINTGVNK